MVEPSSKDASRGFSEVVNRARYAHERTLITVRGRPAAVVVPLADLAQLKAPASANVSTTGAESARTRRGDEWRSQARQAIRWSQRRRLQRDGIPTVVAPKRAP